ncbi:DNA polymerase III subunit beta [Candidatus Saccharibacteria bacterium]|nr:DNA polymerase III subunit beta [Candidatus Saccharibacteria bacterium]
MKLQVTQENLAKALQTVARIANTRNALPILGNVLLRTVDNRLSVSATNLDIAITHLIGSKVSEEGAITVPARLMQDFVSSLPSGVISLELEDHKLHISTDQYQSTINGVAADDFPVMPDITEGRSWQVAASVLKKGLQQTVLAASSDEARPVLTGVYMHSHDGKLYLVATDSYRLAEKSLTKQKDDISLLVPGGAMQDMLRILGDGDETVSITHDDQQVLFRVGEVELVSRLIDGAYPDYRKLIPSSFAVTATLSRDDFTNITKVSSLFARESAGSVTIKVDEASKQVSINSIASQLGENTASAPAEITGDGEVTLNSRYLLDALHVFSGDTVTFQFNGKLEPSLLTDPKSSDYKHIVMPLRS